MFSSDLCLYAVILFIGFLSNHSMELTTQSWILLSVVAIIVGISKTGLPGIGILSVVLTIWVVGVDNTRLANGTLLILLLLGDVFAVAWYRRHADWKVLVRLLPPAAAGILLAYALAKWLQQTGAQSGNIDKLLARAIGAIVLILLVVNFFWSRRRAAATGKPANPGPPAAVAQPCSEEPETRPNPAGIPAATADAFPGVPQNWTFAIVVGGLAGVATMLSNAAGPLVIIYLLAMRLDKHAFLGTSAWYFLMLNSFKVPFMADLNWITPQTFMLNLPMLPVVICGALLGVAIARYLPQRVFRQAVEILAAAGALKLAIG